jgi:hypothetical protein
LKSREKENLNFNMTGQTISDSRQVTATNVSAGVVRTLAQPTSIPNDIRPFFTERDI